ncbi:MAG: BLUF domain-containing protein [Methylococcales bacterium]|nr:BLUF domain-containing protein [Methylococcales bacterium]
MIYASRVSAGFGAGDVEQILLTARERNQKKAITGLLCFEGDNFLQCLEGGRGVVNELYRHILTDQRHHCSTLLYYQAIAKRDFEAWDMGYFGLNKTNKNLLLRYAGQAEFDPFTMTGASADALLCDMKNQL